MTCPKCKSKQINKVTFSGDGKEIPCWIIEDEPHPFNSPIWFKIIYCPYCGIKLPEKEE